MKNKGSTIIIIACFSVMLICVGTVVTLNIIFQTPTSWFDLLIRLMGDLLSAIIIGSFLGLITKIITNRLFSVEMNMKKLRDFGIQGIGTGKASPTDIKRMFGIKRMRKNCPDEMKLLFLTGNVFLKEFKDKIIKCLDEGCKINLLIASPEPENKEYLERCAFKYNNGKIDYAKEIYDDSLKSVMEIKNATKNPENFKVRFYRDEYQNNVRISRYYIGENKERTYYWINVQPLSKTALDLSIALRGKIEIDYSSDETKDENTDICQVSEEGFDKLWHKYENTENILNKIK